MIHTAKQLKDKVSGKIVKKLAGKNIDYEIIL